MNEQQNNTGTNDNDQSGKADENINTSAIHLADSTLQSPEEFEKDKHGDHSKEDNTVTAGGSDDLESNGDGAAGTDRAGTAERKAYGDPELNKGLESQAMDKES